MELPSRARGDELLKPGQCLDIRKRLRALAARADLASVAVSAFDRRTRVLPFFYSSMHMAPAGVRAVASALLDSGFNKTRVVLQQWNPNFQPSRMALDNRMPDLLLVSSMQIHSASCEALIRDACRIDLQSRPLIIVGGPKAIYEPWDLFGRPDDNSWTADLAVTGEDYVLLSLLEVLLTERAQGQSLRAAFERAKTAGLLDSIPGLVYARTDNRGVPRHLVDTGIQRLAGDLDELAPPVLGYGVLERPSGRATLAARPLESHEVRRFNQIGSLVFTSGCRFSCPYCPIPAYNQRQHRVKSAGRIVEEITQLHDRYGMRYFFGTDDNFFNDKDRTLAIVETMAKTQINGRSMRKSVRWATEVTVHDTLQMRDHLRSVRSAGVLALWLGVEDITATFVKKGQSVDKTSEAFGLLRKAGIMPVPMLMSHPGQPLYSRRGQYGLINQVRFLRKIGAIDMQILSMTPAVGSRTYEEPFISGRMIGSAAGRAVEPYMLDANYVVDAGGDVPWKMQLRVAAALAYFYNPARFLWALIRPKSRLYLVDAALQAGGMWGLAYTLPRMVGWAIRLMGKRIPQLRPPGPHLPIDGVAGLPASHGSYVPQREDCRQACQT